MIGAWFAAGMWDLSAAHDFWEHDNRHTLVIELAQGGATGPPPQRCSFHTFFRPEPCGAFRRRFTALNFSLSGRCNYTG
jgi:hypothetical protein